jgi:hypothetical protein
MHGAGAPRRVARTKRYPDRRVREQVSRIRRAWIVQYGVAALPAPTAVSVQFAEALLT